MDIESESGRIREFVDRANYHAAMNLAISALNQCRREHNQDGVNRFLEIIRDIAETMAREFGG